MDSVIEFDRSVPFRGVLEMRGAVREQGPFDCSLDLQRHLKSGFFTWIGGASKRIGFSAKDGKEGNWLFNNQYIENINNEISKVYHYLSFVKELGIAVPRNPKFSIDESRTSAKAEPLLKERNGPFISCVLGSSWESKDWVKEGYSKLIQQLQVEVGGTVILTGDRSQVDLAEVLESEAEESVLNLVGKTDLIELCGVLQTSSIAIGPDTGPGHLASLFDTKYIGLFGPTDPARVAPFGSEHLAQTPPVPCHPCWRRACPGLNKVCMRLHSPEQILGIVKNSIHEFPSITK